MVGFLVGLAAFAPLADLHLGLLADFDEPCCDGALVDFPPAQASNNCQASEDFLALVGAGVAIINFTAGVEPSNESNVQTCCNYASYSSYLFLFSWLKGCRDDSFACPPLLSSKVVSPSSNLGSGKLVFKYKLALMYHVRRRILRKSVDVLAAIRPLSTFLSCRGEESHSHLNP